MFDRLPPPVELEEEVLAFWDREQIFAKSLEKGRGKKPFVFYEGPPTANGTPHNGHVLTRVMKDVFPRYKTMRGFLVDRKAGWDTHGLPVEVEVEKKLGIHGREAIEAYGLDKFSRECLDSVFTYVREWEELTRQIGFWVDLDEAYATFQKTYVESIWWALSQLFEKGLLYQGHKVVWWWPQGGTTLSAGEVGMGYREVDDPAITVRFQLEGDPKTSFLAWTTTPWTLPSNVGLAVGEDIEYALCDDPKVEGGIVILAAARCEAYGLTPRSTIKGRELVGKKYVPLYDFGAPTEGRAFVVVAGEHVTLDAGTGIVHTAPAFGVDDMLVAKEQNLGILQWIDPEGRFTKNTPWAGTFCKDADPEIIQDLKSRGLLFKRDTIRHPYPFCWRADQDPLIQYARPAWFIRTTSFVDDAIANNRAVGWHPEHIQEGRFGDFLRNNVDWALSRERFWGTPLNIWQCTQCGHREAPASVAEIEKRNPHAFDPSVDEVLRVHRPWIDQVTFPCAKCGGQSKRVPEVIDCWFDSGCMPFAQWGWPHQNDEQFKASFPADFISEAVDQTRGWFYSLLMISTLVFDDETCRKYGLDPVGFPRPFRDCIVLGHVCDMEGRKESKSKGNYTSPNLVLRGSARLQALPDPTLQPGQVGLKPDQVPSLDLGKDDRVTISADTEGENVACKVVAADVKPKDSVHLHPDDLKRLGLPEEGGRIVFAVPGEPPGSDAFRWLFCASNAPWSNTRISMRAIRDGQREFLMRLRNVYQFFSIYADIAASNGTFDPKKGAPRPLAQRHVLDRWIADRLAETVATVTENMDAFRLYGATQAVSELVEHLSNWYVRRSRARFWNEGRDLEDALWTLYEVLVDVSKLIAPFVPFTAEAMYQALVVRAGVDAPGSVHLCDWPSAPAKVDAQLKSDMALVRELASLGLSARSASKIKVRQPLAAATVILADGARQAAVQRYAELLTDELNVHEIQFAANAETFVSFQAKPDFKKLGARLGKDMKTVAAAVGQMPGVDVKRALDAGGLDVALPDGRTVRIGPDEVIVTVTPKGEYQAASSAVGVVAMSTHLTDELKAEGLVRELVNRIQNVRKDLDLGYTQRIALSVQGDADLLAAVEKHRDHLTHETLVAALLVGEPGKAEWTSREVDVEGRTMRLAVQPL